MSEEQGLDSPYNDDVDIQQDADDLQPEEDDDNE